GATSGGGGDGYGGPGRYDGSRRARQQTRSAGAHFGKDAQTFRAADGGGPSASGNVALRSDESAHHLSVALIIRLHRSPAPTARLIFSTLSATARDGNSGNA